MLCMQHLLQVQNGVSSLLSSLQLFTATIGPFTAMLQSGFGVSKEYGTNSTICFRDGDRMHFTHFQWF